MKPLWKIIVTISSIATIVGFMMPWITITIQNISVNLTAFDIIRISESVSDISQFTNHLLRNASYSNISIILIPILGIITLTINSLRGPSALYFIASLITVGFFIHFAIHFLL